MKKNALLSFGLFTALSLISAVKVSASDVTIPISELTLVNETVTPSHERNHASAEPNYRPFYRPGFAYYRPYYRPYYSPYYRPYYRPHYRPYYRYWGNEN